MRMIKLAYLFVLAPLTIIGMVVVMVTLVEGESTVFSLTMRRCCLGITILAVLYSEWRVFKRLYLDSAGSLTPQAPLGSKKSED